MPRGQRPYHPFTDFTNYKHNEWEMVCKCRDFLEDASLHGGNCKSITTSKPLKCNCLKFQDKSIAREAAALYMVAFFNKSKVDQQLTIMDWLRYTCLEGKRWFFVPFLNPYEEGGEHNFIDEDTAEKHAVLAALSQTCVCRYAISVLLDWGRRKWETCYRNLEDNTTPTHGLKGKRPNNTIEFDDSTIVEDLVNFFDELKELGQPQSTRIMQVETGVGLRDGEEGFVELPPSFSKRSIYYRFCHDRGWTVKLKKNSNSVLEVTPYWDTNFPNIKIVSRSADVWIVMLLKHKGWMKENEVGGELTVLMDNCGGQNKNNHVLRLANLLVEAGYFKKVNFMFYVVGHTKNCADQLFNTMKRDYRNQNLYTFEQLRKALGTNERITIHSIKDGDFKHYKRLEDLFYKDLKTGTIRPGHIFTVESDASTTIKIWQDCLGTADISVQDLQKRVTVVDCDRRLWEAVQDFVLLDPVAPTGIKEIKQIELYTKWRKLVPVEFVDIICPYPGDEVLRKFKEERNRKARERTQRQRDSRPTKKKTQ
eukprot:jgi/Psemu1/45970/gm1.45970_g